MFVTISAAKNTCDFGDWRGRLPAKQLEHYSEMRRSSKEDVRMSDMSLRLSTMTRGDLGNRVGKRHYVPATKEDLEIRTLGND